MMKRQPMYNDLRRRNPVGVDRHLLNNAAIAAVIPMIVQMIEKEGGCIPRERIERTYGADAVKVMLHHKSVKALDVVRKDKNHRQPDMRIPCLVTSGWDESKPIWLS